MHRPSVGSSDLPRLEPLCTSVHRPSRIAYPQCSFTRRVDTYYRCYGSYIVFGIVFRWVVFDFFLSPFFFFFYSLLAYRINLWRGHRARPVFFKVNTRVRGQNPRPLQLPKNSSIYNPEPQQTKTQVCINTSLRCTPTHPPVNLRCKKNGT